MPIITDGKHLVSTMCEDELHYFARHNGFHRNWYQNHPRHPHYDITTNRMLKKVLKAGAILVSPRKLIKVAWWRQNGGR